jgi:dynein heavy chain, axonemal
MERLIDQFHAIVREFRLKRHDLLDYHNNKFDRDYVEFNVKVTEMRCGLCGFLRCILV